jgi:lysophospholipid acyltransferase (LPLAT)-like uncharacterized protein
VDAAGRGVRGLLRALAGVVLGHVARVWLWSLRVRVEVHPALLSSPRPWVLAFWHGTQWPLLAWQRRRPTVVMVSWSADGAIQARALARQGMEVIRGSSSKGGVRGLAAVVRALKGGARDAAFAVDGPRGPRGRAKEGAVVAARAGGALLVPMGGAVGSGLVLRRAWDQFVVAWPFAEVAVTLGPPLDPALPDARERLEVAIDDANVCAERALGRSGKLGQAGDRVDLDPRAAR